MKRKSKLADAVSINNINKSSRGVFAGAKFTFLLMALASPTISAEVVKGISACVRRYRRGKGAQDKRF